jgi:hypothetical protein
MGSMIEINDTLKLKRGDGFPAGIKEGGEYRFKLPGRRLFHLKPVRVFLVEEIDGKWTFVGQAMILEQTIDAEQDETRGRYVVAALYPADYAALMNKHEAPAGKGMPGRLRYREGDC